MKRVTSPLHRCRNKSNQAFDVKKETELAYHEYLSDLAKYNEMIEDSQPLYKDFLNRLQDLDEERVKMTSTCLAQFFNHFIDSGSIIKDKLEESVISIQLLNPQTDIKIFIDENRSKTEFYKQKEFVSYEYSKKLIERRQGHKVSSGPIEEFDLFDSNRRESVDSTSSRNSEDRQSMNEPNSANSKNLDNFDLLGLSDYEEKKVDKQETDQFNENKSFVYAAIEGLFSGQELDTEAQLKVFELLHENYIGVIVANYLNKINSPRKLASVELLKSLSEIIKYLITVAIHDKHNDFLIIHAVLGCSQSVYAIDDSNMKKILLTHNLRDHGVWQDISKWILWIYKVIENKRQEFMNKKLMSQRSEEGDSPQKNTPRTWLKGLSKMLIGKGASQEDLATTDGFTRNIIFNVLSQFIYHFSNFSMTLEGGKKLILYFWEKYELDRSRVHTLLTEFEAIQRRGGHILTEKEKMMIPMLKRNERLKKFGHNDTTMVMGLIIPYLGDDTTCINVIKMSRLFHEVFKDEIYKQCLIHTEQGKICHNKRLSIWSYFLNIKENVIEYGALRDKINENTEYIKSVDEVISMDVHRSYTNIKNLDQAALKNILRTYAFYNSEIKYCQGMNFLAGFLLMFFQDEELAFKAFSGLIQKFEMTELFKDDMPQLKLFFYKLDRLISMYLPDLYSHFKDEWVQASLFSASWFITLFANTIQFQRSDKINEPLLKLWDFFMVFGYKGVFRGIIFLLKTFETCLYQLSFEQVLAFIPQSPRFVFVPNEEEEKETNDKMIQNLLQQSVQSQDNKISDKIKQIRDNLDLVNNLHKHLTNLNISSFILEKLDTEYYESEKNSNLANWSDSQM